MPPFGSRHLVRPNQPIRAELFSVERLEEHAGSLAAAQSTASKPKRVQPLTLRLYDNAHVLNDAYRAIVKAVDAHQSITPAAEWLLDNFHVVDEQIREIKDDLPPSFYRKLPKLADGPLEGYPRVFGNCVGACRAYRQRFRYSKTHPICGGLSARPAPDIGELWALAITLRITLVENLRRLAEAIVARLTLSRLADTFADRISGRQRQARARIRHFQKPRSGAVVDDFRRSTGATTARSRSKCDARSALAERTARAKGISTDQIVREEVQQQSAMNVTVRNVITSMRLVSMMNWAEFFESVSPVDAVMRRGSDFAAMDFPTRDLYRRAIEDIARGSDRDEVEVARRAIAAAKRGRKRSRRSARAKAIPDIISFQTVVARLKKMSNFTSRSRRRLLRLNSNLWRDELCEHHRRRLRPSFSSPDSYASGMPESAAGRLCCSPWSDSFPPRMSLLRW